MIGLVLAFLCGLLLLPLLWAALALIAVSIYAPDHEDRL